MPLRTLTATRQDAGERLDRFLTSRVPGLSLARARLLIEQGRVRIRGKTCSALRKLWGTEVVELDVPAPRAVATATPEGPRLPILYADEQLVIVDKPAGLTVEPEGRAASAAGLLATQLQGFDVEGRALPGIAHRLDRDTTGCLAFARDDAALAALLRAFAEKRVDKRYLTLVLGHPPDRARLETSYGRDPKNPRRFTTRLASPRRAALGFEVRERFADAALLEVELDTGRTHQIRVQLAEAGFPVLGDAVYGPDATRKHPAAQAIGRQALHAFRLTLPNLATGTPISVESPLPEDFRRALELLRTREAAGLGEPLTPPSPG